MKRRVGLLGGTFDPVHYGHLQLAEIALQKCNLHQVIFVPAATPPHKTSRVITEFRHRANMIQIALEGKTSFGLSSLEADLPAPSYTIDTVDFLTRASKGKEEFYFIIGEDAFLEIATWKSYTKLLSLTHFIVSGRPGYSQDVFRSYVESLGFVLQGQIWLNPSGRREIVFLPTATDDISSSGIRRQIRNKMPVEGLVPGGVIEYIKKNSLFGVLPNH